MLAPIASLLSRHTSIVTGTTFLGFGARIKLEMRPADSRVRLPLTNLESRGRLTAVTTHPQAGFTSPTLRLSAAISGSERPLTTDISRSLSSDPAKCSLVASMALNGAAMATLKYRNDGGPKPRRPTHRDRASSEGRAGIVSCTTQPAGDALSVMHRDLGYFASQSQERSPSKLPCGGRSLQFIWLTSPGFRRSKTVTARWESMVTASTCARAAPTTRRLTALTASTLFLTAT